MKVPIKKGVVILEQEVFDKFKSLMQENEFEVVEEKAILHIKENPNDYQAWVFLAEACMKQQYFEDAYEILERVRLVDPMANWTKKLLQDIESLLPNSKAKKIDFASLIGLKEATVAAAMIIKNDRSNAERWYNSIKGAVDEIVIIDTGSTDGTKEYIESLPDVKVGYFEWNKSMADARNAALPLVQSDWVLWMDSDEYLDTRDYQLNSVRFVARLFESFEPRPKLKIVQMNVIDGSIVPYYDQGRMFSMKDDLHYLGRMHEQVTKKGQSMYYPIPVLNSGIRLIHDGYERQNMEDKRKLERNIEMIQLDTVDDPENPLWWLLLGRETRMAGRFDEALNYLTLAEDKAQHGPTFGRKLDIYENMFYIYHNQNNLEKMEEIAHKMLAISPNFPNAHYFLSLTKLNKGIALIHEAFQYVDNSKNNFADYRGHVTADESILQWKADLLKADIYLKQGNLAKARALYEKIQESSSNTAISNQLAFIQQQQNYLQEGITGSDSKTITLESYKSEKTIDPTKMILTNGHVLKADFSKQENKIDAFIEVNGRTNEKKIKQLAEKYGVAIIQLHPHCQLNLRVIQNKKEIMSVTFEH